MLFNEPKLLKSAWDARRTVQFVCFSALQRAEIAEMARVLHASAIFHACFSALQRAEIAEMRAGRPARPRPDAVSVLFNEPKLLKSPRTCARRAAAEGFSALQRAEIAEIAWNALFGAIGAAVSVLFNEPKLLKC